MAENKEYITQQENTGSILISEDVVASIATAAALETEGVSAMLSARTMLMSRFCIRFSPSQAPSKPGAFVVPSVPRFARFGRFWARIAPQMR